MTVHLLKICVGIDDIPQLERSQEMRIARAGGKLYHRTRHTPRRAEEVLDGGSLYWIIKGFVQVRQRIIGIHRHKDEDGMPYCLLERDPELVPTVWQPRRPHQGWRYLDPEDAPPDLDRVGDSGHEIPPEMAAELRNLGLI